jgi:hypothetical protein
MGFITSVGAMIAILNWTCQPLVPLAEAGAVHIVVTNSFGDSVSEFQIKLTSIADGVDHSDRLKHGESDNVPFGAYILDVTAPGFKNIRRTINVNASDCYFTVGLPLRLGDDIKMPDEYAPYSVTGQVFPAPADDRASWIVMISDYNDYRVEARIGETGKYLLRIKEMGNYTLILFIDRKPKVIEHISLDPSLPNLHRNKDIRY